MYGETSAPSPSVFIIDKSGAALAISKAPNKTIAPMRIKGKKSDFHPRITEELVKTKSAIIHNFSIVISTFQR